MNNLQTALTGDLLLFSGNTPTGFLLRTFTSSIWNHVGIAIRYDFDKKSITLNNTGTLLVFETNSGCRYDPVFNSLSYGASYSNLSLVLKNCNKVAIRRLKSLYRTEYFRDQIISFTSKYKGKLFPETSTAFLSVWLGISRETNGEDGMFCSELAAYFYYETLGNNHICKNLVNPDRSNCFKVLFGSTAQESGDLFAPLHFTQQSIPYAPIFEENVNMEEEVVYIVHGDLLYIILQPLVLTLFVVFFIAMTIPGSLE